MQGWGLEAVEPSVDVGLLEPGELAHFYKGDFVKADPFINPLIGNSEIPGEGLDGKYLIIFLPAFRQHRFDGGPYRAGDLSNKLCCVDVQFDLHNLKR